MNDTSLFNEHSDHLLMPFPWNDLFNFLFFICLCGIAHEHEFVDIEPFLYPWDRSYLIMIYNPLNVLLNSVTNVLLIIFVSVFISDIGLFTF